MLVLPFCAFRTKGRDSKNGQILLCNFSVLRLQLLQLQTGNKVLYLFSKLFLRRSLCLVVFLIDKIVTH